MFGKRNRYVDHKLVRYTFFDALRDAFAFLGRFFSWRNMKHALRSVTGGFREYIIFYIALTIVQMLFWTNVIYVDTACAAAKSEAYANCDYHLMIDGFEESEWTNLYNTEFYVAVMQDPEDSHFISYEAEAYTDAFNHKLVQVKFLLTEDSVKACEDFIIIYKLNGDAARKHFGERATYPEKVSELRTTGTLVTFGLAALSVLILLVLFNIRSNHYKFKYGIYMAFGANLEKLFETAAWELTAISLFTYLPSLALTYGIFRLFAAGAGTAVTISWGRLPAAFIFVYATVLFAVLPSVRILSRKTPISLVIAQDNSNLVTSPRRSFRIVNKKFPVDYELFGFWRFRRYYAGLLLSAIVFSSLFVCGSFVGDMINTSENAPKRQFNLNLTGEDEFDTVDIDYLRDYDGISFIYWKDEVSSTALRAHAVLTRQQAAGISSRTVAAQQAGMKASNDFKFSCMTDQLVESATDGGLWKVEGDATSIFTQPYTVIVSEQINNKNCMNFKVGDTITIALFEAAKRPLKSDLINKRDVLSRLVSDAYFNFVEVKIGAVIDTGDIDDEFTIGMSPDLYTELTGRDPEISTIAVYLDSGLTHAQVGGVYEDLRRMMSYYDVSTITSSGADYDYSLESDMSAHGPVISAALLILIVSPLVWFFSQSMFGAKRGGELYMLSAFGAGDSRLRRMQAFSGGVLALFGCIITVLLGSLISRLVYSFINEWLPSVGMGSAIRYTYSINPALLCVCVAVSGISAFLATYLIFTSFRKNRDRILRTHDGDGANPEV